MENKQIRWLNVFKVAGAIIAFLIGAGFATGQEVFQFYAAYGYQGVFGALFVFACFAYACGEFILLGYDKRMLNASDIYRYYCGRYAGCFYDFFSLAFIYMTYVVMLSGAGATAHQYYRISPAVGSVAMAVLSAGTVVFGLNRLVDVIAAIGPLIVVVSVAVGIGGIVMNPGGVAEGARLLASGTLEITRVGSSWLMAGASYVGFCVILFPAFLAALGAKSSSRREALWGTTLGAAGFTLGVLILMFGLIACVKDLYSSDIPSLVIAERIWPSFAAVFSLFIVAGIFTTAVPLLWTVAARFAAEKTPKFWAVTVFLSAGACFVALKLPFRQIVNVIYGINGYVGILIMVFLLAKTLGITKK